MAISIYGDSDIQEQIVTRILMAIVAIILALIVYFVIAGKRRAENEPDVVVGALRELVSPNSTNLDEWDLFLGTTFKDPYLESVRQRCLQIVAHDSGKNQNAYLSKRSVEQIAALLNEVEARRADQNSSSR